MQISSNMATCFGWTRVIYHNERLLFCCVSLFFNFFFKFKLANYSVAWCRTGYQITVLSLNHPYPFQTEHRSLHWDYNEIITLFVCCCYHCTISLPLSLCNFGQMIFFFDVTLTLTADSRWCAWNTLISRWICGNALR